MKLFNVIRIIVLCWLVTCFKTPAASMETAIRHFEQNQLTIAEAQFLQLKKRGVQPNESQFYLARIALSTGKLEDALTLFEAITLLEKSTISQDQYYYWLGITNAKLASNASWFKAAGYAIDAKAHFEKAVQLAPQNIRARRGLFRYYLNAPGIAGGSIKKAKKQIAALKEVSHVYADLLALELAQYEKDKAQIAQYANQLITYTHHSEALYKAGMAYQSVGEFDKTFSAFKNAIVLFDSQQKKELFQFSVLSLYQFSKTAVIANKHFEAGIETMKRYLNQLIQGSMPERHWAKFRLGQLYWLAGNQTEAERLFNEIKGTYQDEFLTNTLQEFLANQG
ncbi:lipopolysaccharide assembly protein LapB [Colwellia sp. RSH04]|uniref:tetratricopeptide repeat protein n=1 Tax=Colwellia sp. RSH04 TaxID=2305464 RepID=UPI000E5855B6|nr:tetratricopeptide repeat protein [Colwellia sp. RSH04]RHW77901.1 hypothetical protein D1094_02965 [Colwellia sp. RSH04]